MNEKEEYLHTPLLPERQFHELAQLLVETGTGRGGLEKWKIMDAMHWFFLLSKATTHAFLFDGLPTQDAALALEVDTTQGKRWMEDTGQFHASFKSLCNSIKTRGEGEPIHFQSTSPRALLHALDPTICLGDTLHHGKMLGGVGGMGIRLFSTRELSAEEQDAMVQELWGFSCHPYIGKLIVKDIVEKGERSATVMPGLFHNLENLRNRLAPLGVEVWRTYPMPSRGQRDIPENEPRPEPPSLDVIARNRPRF